MASDHLKRAVFMARDGVLNRAIVVEGRPHAPRRVEEFELLPGVVEACARLKAAGFFLVIATNQPDVGRGVITQETVEAMHERIRAQIPIDRIEACYAAGSSAGQPSDFRKPAPGMLLRAAHELGVTLQVSWMIGDRWRDVDCGRAARCHTIFLNHGYTERLRHPPDFTVTSFSEAVDIVLEYGVPKKRRRPD